ncbi:MAG TPA: hypothetical protein VKY19_19850 [Ktedonosporobacter sp.]|jgi:hypothetical protein|nr:hypothetical protein [Ktedonosporobacter sp.]
MQQQRVMAETKAIEQIGIDLPMLQVRRKFIFEESSFQEPVHKILRCFLHQAFQVAIPGTSHSSSSHVLFFSYYNIFTAPCRVLIDIDNYQLNRSH